ncbi:MAG: hypothetical protein IJO56_06385 [Oscillospiraceae bacterium]|nr:hypothetical protein [Oscillospiraceae bacterium]
MRRKIAIFLVLVALLSCATMPAAASEIPGADSDPEPYYFDSEYQLSYEDIPMYGTGFYPGGLFDMSKNTGDSRPTYTFVPESTASSSEYSLVLTMPEWYGYDFLDIQVHLDVLSITSISAVLGDVIIPFETSTLPADSFDSQDIYLTCRLDLRGLSYTTSSDPVLDIRGSISYDYQSEFYLNSASGVTIVNDPDLSFFDSLLDALHDMHVNIVRWFEVTIVEMGSWFNNLESSFDASIQKVVDAINGDSSAGDEFGSEIETQASKLEEMGAVFDSVERPDLDDVQMSVDAYLSPADLHNSTAGLSAAISSGPILSVFMMALILATVGYILYGKK